MKNRRLRKAAFILICTLIAVSLSCGLAEDAGGKGTVIVLDSPAETPAADPVRQESAPFAPKNLAIAPRATGSDNPDEDVDCEVFDVGAVRVTVTNTDEYPFSAIAYMDMHYECGCTATGTGFMVGPDELPTAAHCLVCSDHSAWADEITFYFGYKDSTHYSHIYNGRWTAYAGNLFSNGEYTTDWDYGCMKLLDEPVGNDVGWFGYRYGDPDRIFDYEYLYIAGYRHGVLTYDGGYAEPNGYQLIQYLMDMEPGNSGGPVYTTDYYAIAINIAENEEWNYGYRVTEYVIEELLRLE